MLSCRDLAQQHASDYLDGQLGLGQRVGFRMHLMLCGHCRQFIRQLRTVRRVLQRLPAPATDETHIKKIATHLHAVHREQNKFPTPL